MRCVVCGNEFNENNKFCPNCGAQVGNSNNDINLNTNMDVSNNLNMTNNEVVNNNGNNLTDNIVVPDSDVNNQSITNNVNNSFKNSRKKKSKVPFIIIGVIIILAIVSVLLYLFVFNRKSSKEIFVDGFKNVTKELFSDSNTSRTSVKNKLSFNVSAPGLGMDQAFNLYNNIILNSNLGIDLDLKKIDEELTLNYKGKDILGLGIYGRDNTMYLGLNGIYDKYVKLPITEDDYNKLFSKKVDYKILKNALDDAFEKSIDSKYFTKSKRNVSSNGKNKKYNAYTLTIDNNNIKEITKSFINSLINNEEFISYISKNFDIDKSTINSYISSIDYNDITIDTPIMITVFTSGLIESYKGIEISINSSGYTMAVRYIELDDNNAEITLDAGITSFVLKVTSSGSDNNKKTTYSVDLGTFKGVVTNEQVKSDKVEFKNIDASNVISYEEFMTKSEEIFDNLESNPNFKQFIEDFGALDEMKLDSNLNSFNLSL